MCAFDIVGKTVAMLYLACWRTGKICQMRYRMKQWDTLLSTSTSSRGDLMIEINEDDGLACWKTPCLS